MSEQQAVLHDIRYSRFRGDLRPRSASVAALARSSAQRALGIRRSAGAKIWPFLLVAAAFSPAVVAVGLPLLIADAFGPGLVDPIEILGYGRLVAATGVVVLAFAATTLPSLLTRERRDRVLSLYFSTALSPAEYVAGKLLAALALMLLVTFGPMLLLLVGAILTADAPVDYAREHAGDLPRIVAAGLLVAGYHAAVGLALGSLTARRVFAVGGYLALMLVPAGVGGILYAVSGREEVLALNLLYVPIDLAREVLGEGGFDDGRPVAPTEVGLAVWALVVALGLATLLVRYVRRSES